MVFSSLVFLLIFLPAALGCYYATPGIRGKNAVLCLFSLVFYAWGEPVYLFLMLFLILVNYLLALGMGENAGRGGRKALLILALVIDLSAVGFFKYGDFAQKSLLKIAVYISLFPQLVAGPIVRYQTIANELDNRQHSLPEFSRGLHRFVLGLGKKVILANGMALLSDTVFGQAGLPAGAALWLGAAAYMLQIYYDFSGYSDMAIGMGRMFGFHFPENFDHPYIASSVAGFWRRWHISLSAWFRDYVYIPLGGSRRGLLRTVLNLLIVWLLTGLWVWGSWYFVLLGLYYFVFLSHDRLVGGRKAPARAGFFAACGGAFDRIGGLDHFPGGGYESDWGSLCRAVPF